MTHGYSYRDVPDLSMHASMDSILMSLEPYMLGLCHRFPCATDNQLLR